jgi:hypothetical protein
MDVLLALFGLMLLFLMWFGPASWAARRGIGTRWTWLRGGIGGLLLVVLVFGLSAILERPAPVPPPSHSTIHPPGTRWLDLSR